MRVIGGLNGHRLVMLGIVAILSLAAGGAPTGFEYALLDARFAVNRAVSASDAPADVVVLLVTPESERRLDDIYGSQWRRWYPAVVRTLAEAGARGVVWDATFLASHPELDADVAAAFAELPVIAAENGYERNNAVIRPALAAVGWKQLVTVQSIPRRTHSDTSLPALGRVAAALVSAPQRPSDRSIWLDFSHDPRAVPAFDLADLILADADRLADAAATPISVFTDRVVFIGTDLPGADRYAIPGARRRVEAGVLGQVASMWSYLTPRPITRVEGWLARAAVFVSGAMLVLIGTARHRRVRGLGGVLWLAAVLAVPYVSFALWRLWLPAAAMIGIASMAIVLVALSHRIRLSQSYRTSLGFHPNLLEDHNIAPHHLAAGVERRAAVLCADVRGYTQFVSDHPSDDVQRVMSRYMAAMEGVIHEHGGYINKFVGDEIVAVFGFPLSDRGIAERATTAGRDMLLQVQQLNAEWSLAGLPTLDGIGVGIDAGELRFINIGGSHRVQFDVIGGAINGASRLQGLTKQMDHPLVVSAEVAEHQTLFVVEEDDESTGARTGLEFIGEIMVRGQGRRRLFGLPRTTMESWFPSPSNSPSQ